MSTALSDSESVSRISVANALSRVTGVTNGAVLAAVADQMFFDIHRNPQQWQAGLGDAQVLAYVQNYGSAELKREMQERSYGKSDDTPNAAFRSAALLVGTLAPWQQYAGLRGMGGTGMNGTEQGTGSGSSGARYDGVNNANYSPGSPAYWASAQGMSEMRSYAMQQGLGWAAGVPEILRMGPEAVKALADVQLKKQSYDRLTKDADFAPKDVVTLAKFAKKKGVDANNLSRALADFEKDLPPGQKTKLNNDALIPYMASPDRKDLQENAVKAIDDAAGDDQEKRRKGEELKKQLKLITQQFDNANKAKKDAAAGRDTAEAQAIKDQQSKTANLEFFSDSSPPQKNAGGENPESGQKEPVKLAAAGEKNKEQESKPANTSKSGSDEKPKTSAQGQPEKPKKVVQAKQSPPKPGA